MVDDRFNYHECANSLFIVCLDISSSNPAKGEGGNHKTKESFRTQQYMFHNTVGKYSMNLYARK
jgi:hypothetical protein